MEELLKLLWRGLIPDLRTITFLVSGLGPLVAFALVFHYHHKQEKKSDPPQSEKLLRPPGYSLMLKLDETVLSMFEHVLWAACGCVMAGVTLAGVATVLGVKAPWTWSIPFALVALISAALGIKWLLRACRMVRECQNLRLGLRGEQAVGEALHEAAEVGFKAFHDLPAEKNWNIDHVVVGPGGLFLVETKARRRRTPKRDQEKHVAIQSGNIIKLPFGNDLKSIPQAERNSKWLTDYLAKKTGELVKAEGIVALPGWYVETDYKCGVKAMNADYLVKYLRKRPASIEPAQVRRMVTALEEKCRTLEF